MRGYLLLIKAVLYLASCRLALMIPDRTRRGLTFALINVAAFISLTYAGLTMRQTVAFSAAYLAFAVAHYALIRTASTRFPRVFPLATLFPVSLLVLVRVIPLVVTSGPLTYVTICFAGLSFLSFRLSHLTMEVRNGIVSVPTLGEYLSFAFFVPLSSVGPIQPYSRFIRGFTAPSPLGPGFVDAILRIVVGVTKYVFLGNLVNQLSFTGLMQDGNLHHRIDFAIAMAAYYVYLYLNFSGFCDIVIGASGLIGIAIDENFDHPFRARNVKDFWTRWHITLSSYLRDMVFTPLSKTLIRLTGPAYANHCVAIAIVTIFVLVGLFHGFAWNFLFFGLAHAAGVVLNHYYDIWLKRRLGREGYRRYEAHPGIRYAAQIATQVFVAASFLLFANSIETIRVMAEALR